jgi:hypothetical protein
VQLNAFSMDSGEVTILAAAEPAWHQRAGALVHRQDMGHGAGVAEQFEREPLVRKIVRA